MYIDNSVINPRGFASILWKDPAREKEAAELMKIGAGDLVSLGICSAVIHENEGAEEAAENLRRYLEQTLPRLCAEDTGTLLKKRYARYRNIGAFTE